MRLLKWILSGFILAVWVAPQLSAQLLQRAVIVRPPDTTQFAVDNDPVPLWQNLLRAFDIFATPVDLDDLGSQLIDANLLVLPDIRSFTQGQRDAIQAFIQQGNHVIMTGRTGEATVGGGRTLAGNLNLNYVQLPTHDDLSWWVVMDEPGRHTAGIPRMQRMSVQSAVPVALASPSSSVAFWLSGEVAKPDFDNAARNSAVHVGNLGSGKFLWTGFDIADLGGDFASAEVTFRLFDNVFSDFKGLPVLEVSPWPFPYRTAIIYSMDVEERFGNMNFVHEIPGLSAITYFILTFSADLHQNILAEIGLSTDLRRHRVVESDVTYPVQPGAEVAVHGDNHDLFRGQTLETQIQRLQRTSDYIYQITGHRPIGFRPPEESFDFFTLQALLKTGFEYILGDNEPDRAQPRIRRVGDQRLVQMAILNKDDVNLVIQANRPDPEIVLDKYLRDIDSIFRRGGLYVVNLHSQILAVDEYLPVLAEVVRYTNQLETWTVNGATMHDWWFRRDGVVKQVTQSSTLGVRFTLRNMGRGNVNDLAVNVWIPENARTVRVESPAGGRRILDFIRDRSLVTVRVPNLAPGESLEYDVQWRE